jgi:hypothetical protein
MASKVFADGRRLEHLPGYMGMTTRHTDDTATDSLKAWDTFATLPWVPLLRMCDCKYAMCTTDRSLKI